MEASHEVVNYRLAKIAVFNAVGYGYDAVPFMNPRIVFDALGGTISTYEVVDGEALSVRIVIASRRRRDFASRAARPQEPDAGSPHVRFDEDARTPAIRRRLGERAKSTRSGRSLRSLQDHELEGRKRARSSASSAWRRVFVLAKTAFNWLRAVSRLTPSEDAAPSIPTPEASFAASFASATVRPNAAQNCVASGRSGDLRSVIVGSRDRD